MYIYMKIIVWVHVGVQLLPYVLSGVYVCMCMCVCISPLNTQQFKKLMTQSALKATVDMECSSNEILPCEIQYNTIQCNTLATNTQNFRKAS